MKKLSVMVMTMFLLSFSSFAQDKEYFDEYCGTTKLTDEQIEQLPWYGNNDFLLDWLDSLEKSSSGMRVERIAEGYQVAVQAWVYHKDEGTGIAPENWEIARWLNMMNETENLI